MKIELLDKISRAFTEGVVFCDPNGKILHINAIGKRILSAQPSISSCGNLSVISQAPELHFTETIGRYIRSGQMTPIPKFTFEETFRHCHFEGMRISSPELEAPYLLLIKFWDQTIRVDRFAALNMSRLENQQNQQRYLKAIKQNESNMRLALSSTRESIWMFDVVNNTLESALIWEKILGFEGKPRPISLDSLLSHLHPDDAPLMARAIDRLIKHDMVLDIQYRIFDQHNRLYWFHLRGRATTRDNLGQAITVYGLHSDITSAKLIEQKLSDTDASMNSLLRSMVDGVFIAREERFIFANESLLSILGYSKNSFLGLPFERVVFSENLDVWKKRYRARLDGRTDIPSRFETRLTKSDGKTIWVELISTQIDYQGQSCVMGIIHDITQHKASEQLIWQQANYDALTALANRQYFETILHQKMIRSQRLNTSFALLLIDLDNFKDINDTQGHDSGDQILLQVAQRLYSLTDKKGVVGRFGGDEFVILLDDIAMLENLESALYMLLSTIKAPIAVAGAQYTLTASIGVSLYPCDASSPSVLLRNADQAMYVAKHAGRDRFMFFTPDMHIAAHNKVVLINDMREAMHENQWLLHYQPIIDLQQRMVTKAEALIRWQHPAKGLIPPDEFIPVAEESGLILQIGEWVLHEAINTARELREKVSNTFQMTINQSSKQFQQHDERIQELTEIIAQHHVEPDMIVIEITESALFDGGQIAMQRLEKLRDMGIEVALDDFGTGYSSLSYLKKLDIDVLKIDRSFVSQLEQDTNDQVLVEAIILMAHKLGLKVVAEGIETLEQLHILLRAGCDFGQGYLFTKPLLKEDLEQFIAQFVWPLPTEAPKQVNRPH